ncbi:hypothetical protein Ptr902_02314 [Pyrenophora tritici-repentis]|uniref:Uncharacterized protein n=1 Tax=Pyrenophora tritici-repentis TaxID=45151 RepID=A0A2W1FLU4_9PLEO|nr:hypothetical protein PtrV1_09429 [Pyrenophora tritici-repentis]KAF7443120.1 hypothetical protein A1F99_126270 [Pyrenophora tritici-repentis]KAI0571979.1 hypothetical protein Alg130_10681 [Pyrenophora tritici-repentis]KAI0604885.1 hypothetical protein TUN205_10868 [Pyrenophora tritici-repentis]KAI0617160.1 hypothetical protein TUN199_10848 [Pyrenophora tritici-repentis]
MREVKTDDEQECNSASVVVQYSASSSDTPITHTADPAIEKVPRIVKPRCPYLQDIDFACIGAQFPVGK